MNLSPHFTLDELTHSEWAARNGIPNDPGPHELANLQRLARLLEEVRALLGAPMQISSGYRSRPVNKAVGGAPNSAHMFGCAADFKAPGFGRPLDIALAISRSAISFDQLIHEFGSWVHISVAPLEQPRRMLLTIDRRGTHAGLIEST